MNRRTSTKVVQGASVSKLAPSGTKTIGPMRGTVWSLIGAALGRPPCAWILITCSRDWIFGRPKPLVNKSAGLVWVRHFSRRIPRFFTICCTHKSPVARWRTRPKPSLLQMPMAAVASDRTIKEVSQPKSLKQAWAPSPSPHARTIAASSLSPDDKHKVGRVLLKS